MKKLCVSTVVAMVSLVSVLMVEASIPQDRTLDEIARHREWHRVTPALFPLFTIASAAI